MMTWTIQSTFPHKIIRPQEQPQKTLPHFYGKGDAALPRAKSDSFLLRHTEPLKGRHIQAQQQGPFIYISAVQDLIQPLIPEEDGAETVLEQLLDSRLMKTALEQYKTACHTGPSAQAEFAREAEHSFIKAVPDFTVPYHQALCHLFAASSARLAKQDVKTVNYHVEQALDSLLKHTTFISQSLQKIETPQRSTEELQDILKVTDEAINLLNHNQNITRFFEACWQLHTNPALVPQQQKRFSEQLQEVTRQAREIKLNRVPEENEFDWRCIIM